MAWVSRAVANDRWHEGEVDAMFVPTTFHAALLMTVLSVSMLLLWLLTRLLTRLLSL